MNKAVGDINCLDSVGGKKLNDHISKKKFWKFIG